MWRVLGMILMILGLPVLGIVTLYIQEDFEFNRETAEAKRNAPANCIVFSRNGGAIHLILADTYYNFVMPLIDPQYAEIIEEMKKSSQQH